MSVRILYPNYFETENYSSLAASSANPSFPVTNLQGDKRRSKVWRSAGFFRVTSSNNVIKFRETTGVDLTATIATGDYASIALMLVAIKTALQAVGASTYTVTQLVNFKFSISSNHTGGGGIFELRFENVLSTAADMLGFSPIAYTGGVSYAATSTRIHTEEFITIDLGSAFKPTAFGIVGPRNMPMRIQGAATVQLMANATDSWSSPAYTEVITTTDFGGYTSNDNGISNNRYWHLRIVDRDNARGYVEISSLFLGQWLPIVKGCPQFPLPVQEVDLTSSERGLSGGSFSSVYGKTAEITLDWKFIVKAEVEAMRDFFREVGIGYPFFVMLDPDEAFSTDLDRWFLMTKFDSAPSFSLDQPGYWSSDWKIVEDV